MLPTPIPLYDAGNGNHQRLAELSVRCHDIVSASETSQQAEIGRLRQEIRGALRAELRKIVAIARKLLSLSGER